MNRRGFLKVLAGLPLVGLAIPKAAALPLVQSVATGKARGNALLTPEQVTAKALAILHQKLNYVHAEAVKPTRTLHHG